MKEQFQSFNFKQASLDMIAQVNAILATYQAQGYTLTLRQVYYQLVARNLVVNSEKSYDNVGALINNGRLAGMIDWDAIEDRTRSTTRPPAWGRPYNILRASSDQFRINKWHNQPNHVRVLVEKQALEGILIPVCRELDILFAANRGYSSSSAMYEMGQELAQLRRQGKRIHVLYLGDHDPSGMDMSRDVEDRLEQFSRGTVYVNRLALNMDQIEQYGPPENPAKLSDSRSRAYVEQYGESSWELDALEPTVLAALVRDAVADLRDDELFRGQQRREARMRIELNRFVNTAGRKDATDYDDPANYEEPGTVAEIYTDDETAESDCYDVDAEDIETTDEIDDEE